MKSLLFLVVLSLSRAACTGSNEAACGSDCVWIRGSCKAFTSADCNLASGCVPGCSYIPAVTGKCFDEGAEECLKLSTDQCTGNCAVSSGSCVLSGSVQCPSGKNWECPSGCKQESVGECVAQDDGISGDNSEGPCTMQNNAVLTQCGSYGDCKWDANTSKCVLEQWNGTDDCEYFDNSPVTDCDNAPDGLCHVQGSACVYNSEYRTRFCSLIENATQGYNQCTRYGNCKIENNTCVGLEVNDSMDSYCRTRDPTETTRCEYYSDGLCYVSNNQCVPGLNQYCATYYGDDCENSNGLCALEGNACVFAPNVFCGTRSATTTLTRCTQYTNCKVGSNQECLYKSADELCVGYSIAQTYSECEAASRWQCKINGSKCVPDGYYGNVSESEEYCGGLSIIPTVSECENRRKHYNHRCRVVDGACKGYTPICQLNQMNTGCSNPPEDNCYYQDFKACSNVDCSQYGNDNCEVNYGDAGCEWSTADVCVSSLSCNPSDTGECAVGSDPGCTNVPSSVAVCSAPSNLDATCVQKKESGNCNDVSGCKWHANDGGVCYEKNCTNSPSYSLCCPTGAVGCSYCPVINRPADCPSLCDLSPSFIICCPSGSADCSYCQKSPKPDDCPEGGGGAFFVHTPLLLLLLVLMFFL